MHAEISALPASDDTVNAENVTVNAETATENQRKEGAKTVSSGDTACGNFGSALGDGEQVLPT